MRVAIEVTRAAASVVCSRTRAVLAIALMPASITLAPGVGQARCPLWPEIVSVSSAGEMSEGGPSTPSVNADGRFVAFESLATNLVPGDTNAIPGQYWSGMDVFVRDRLLRLTERVSVSSSDEQGNGDSRLGAISADGRFVVFASQASVVYHKYLYNEASWCYPAEHVGTNTASGSE